MFRHYRMALVFKCLLAVVALVAMNSNNCAAADDASVNKLKEPKSTI